MEYKKFTEDELQVTELSHNFRGVEVPVYNFPVSPKEEWRQMALERKPLWLNSGVELLTFFPRLIPDNIPRGFGNDAGVGLKDEEKGGKDMFGVSWTYVPVAGGSMETPGVPHLLNDISEWREKLVWPDVDSWDWEGSAKLNEEFLKTDKFVQITIVLFTTGNGNPFGALVPTVKLSSNTNLYNRKKTWIDYNAGQVLEGKSWEEVTEDFFHYILEVASGRAVTNNERYGYREAAIFRDGVIL